MIAENMIAMSQYTSVSTTVSYSQTQIVQTSRQNEDESIEDKVKLNDAFSAAEKLKSAESTDELLALLEEGQKQAQKVLDDFRALAMGLVTGDEPEFDADYVNDLLFAAVHDAVESILEEQMEKLSKVAEDGSVVAASVSVSVTVEVSFEARMVMAVQDRAPDFFDKMMEMLEENSRSLANSPFGL